MERETNDRNEINSVVDHCFWLCIPVSFSSSIGKVFGFLAYWFVPIEFEVLSAVFLLLLIEALASLFYTCLHICYRHRFELARPILIDLYVVVSTESLDGEHDIFCALHTCTRDSD